NQNDLAEEAFKKAIEANENFLEAYFTLGQLYIKSKAYDRAIQQYETMIKANPKLVQPYMLLGILYDQQGKRQQANAQYEQALKINPRLAPAANNLAWNTVEDGGNLDVALGLAQTAKEQAPEDPSVSDTLAWIYYKKHVYAKAIGLLRETAAKRPENAVVH